LAQIVGGEMLAATDGSARLGDGSVVRCVENTDVHVQGPAQVVHERREIVARQTVVAPIYVRELLE